MDKFTEKFIQDTKVEIEAIEHAIENAFFVVEREALEKRLFQLQKELEEASHE